MLDRNNVVNKGLWVRNRVENKNPGDFIFRANSLDVDSVLQNNFDAFGDNNVQNSPFLTSYVERNKRSPIYKSKRDSKENVNKCKNKSQCISTDKKEDSIIKSKFISTLKPSSFLMEYPHAVAALINDERKHESETKDKKQVIKDAKKIDKVKSPISTNLSEINQENIIGTDNDATKTIIEIPTTTSFMKRDVNNTLVIPRRNHNYKYELIKDFEFKEINNTDNDKKDVFRSVFDKEDIAWQNSAPISNANVYKVIPKSQENVKNKPITERGIIKVLSILTKTFKKIMKQHNDIKRIHKRLNNLNDDFVKNVEILTNKFEDFNSKYSEILKVDQELKQVLAILKDKEQYFLAKEKDMTKNLLEFENQQKKFLLQQKQFYNVQKLILTQNEKINLKQDIIAKTQSEISQRQNNFARILKKAKQIYIDTKNSPSKLNTGITKSKTDLVKEKLESVKDATTVPTTESVKINLFAIPTTSSIKNQDQILIKEKDDHSIDDLILKYYFNNTFLDEIMKSKILSAFLNEENPKNSKKSKRNQSKLNSTILLPVNKLGKDINTENKTRQRRWIKHSKKNVHKNVKITTSKPKTNIKENVVDTGNTVPININKILLKNAKAGPFMTMAISFCKEIGQDISLQSLNWCVEKTLRRLQVKEFKMESVMRPSKPGQMTEKQNISQNDTSTTGPYFELGHWILFYPENLDEYQNVLWRIV
ncbi:unnamed protein product [Euphydryas editha]|uniref:Uncharacterized protein n=1 Tax=Euphydryas editha TaxID=104508 RepID=A0AAU9UQ47_EUPED|nr:unnamed protein product [Euphydryas editha]